jgi:hypothetical protein
MISSLSQLRKKVVESRAFCRLFVAQQELRQPKAKDGREVIFMPGEMHTGTAGDLRARAISRELRALGWRTLLVPPFLNLEDRQAIVNRHPSAILFFQQSRHKLNLPSLYPNHKTILDADDADILITPAHVIECLKTSTAVIAGSHMLANEFKPYNSNVSVVWTGSYVTETTRTENPKAKPIIAWAQSDPFNYPMEAELVKDIWLSLAGAGYEFSPLVYSDEPNRVMDWLGPVQSNGIDVIIRPTMRYVDFVQSLTDVSIGLQPICISNAFSRGKSFGKVLAYLAAGVPVIASRAVDHELFFRDGENGLLVCSESEFIVACKRLLANRAERQKLATNALKDLRTKLTTRRASEQVATVLERLLTQ